MNHNVITYEEINNLIDIIKIINVDTNTPFDFLKILKKMEEPEGSNVLYFPIYIDDADDGGGWYPNSSDTRKSLSNYIIEHPNYTYVLDEETYHTINNNNLKIIVVSNIMELVNNLFKYILDTRNYKTILVTGSVGKTTTVGLIESVIKDNVLRIYSKRITPIVLKAHIINYLTTNIEYLVLEAGLYYKHHVKYFGDTLNPYISICLNVLPEHLGIDGISCVEDITYCKSLIFEHCKYALINKKDNELNKLNFMNGEIIYNGCKITTQAKEVYDISNLTCDINMYLKTNLSKIQYGAAYYVGKILNIPENVIIERLNQTKPVENRVNKNILYDREIIFDGEVSGVARFSLFTDHFYDRAVLVIRSLTQGGEEDEDYSKFPQYFKRFEKVYLFDDLECLSVLEAPNTIIVSNHDFIKEIDKDVQIFYHYGSFYRKYNEFNIDNLIGNDK